jgi:tetratricopeptide (TPR) repeat protein
MKKPKKHPEFIYMIVSIIAFVFTAIAIIVFSHVSGIYTRFSFEVTAVLVFLCILVIPAVIKAYAYSNMFRFDRKENNFSASFAINEYKLNGWMKGKYIFLEAVSEACNGNFEHGFELYVECLGTATDLRLRHACYRDMIKNLKRMQNPIRIIPYIRKGFEEFPDDMQIFEHIAQYYMWYPFADENEALEWFTLAAAGTRESRIRARADFYTGCTLMYRKEYENALEHFILAKSAMSPAPCYLLVDMAVCAACLGRYDEARGYAVQAVVATDSKDDLDYIAEKLDYLFRITDGTVNPQSEKLIDELKRRREAAMEDSVQISDIEKFNSAVEKAKERIQ